MKRKRAERIVREALERARVAKLRQATPPVDVRRVVAKAAPAISEAIAQRVGAAYGAVIADLSRRVAQIAAMQATAPADFYGYVDPATRKFVPLPPVNEPPDRELAKAERLAAAAAVLPDGAPLRSELGKAGAYRDLIVAPPWRQPPNDTGPGR